MARRRACRSVSRSAVTTPRLSLSPSFTRCRRNSADSAVATTSVVAMLAKLDGQKRKLTAELEKMRGEIASKATMDLSFARDRVAAVIEYYRGERELSEEQRIELRQILRETISRID